jgi:hypothetical protein
MPARKNEKIQQKMSVTIDKISATQPLYLSSPSLEFAMALFSLLRIFSRCQKLSVRLFVEFVSIIKIIVSA